MARILHTGDIHLGVKLSGLGKSGDKVRAALKDSFCRMVDICLESDVDAFIIAGDLFESNKVSKPLLDFALREIGRLGDIPAIVIPGTHDCLDENSIYLSLQDEDCPSNLHLFNDPDRTKFKFPDLGLTFYANPNQTIKSSQSPLTDLAPDGTPGYHIAVAHGSLAIPGKSAPDDWPISLEEIESSGFNYIALGHWHSNFQAPTKEVPAAYCGTPECMSFKQQDCGWANLLTLNEGKVIIEKIQTGVLDWQTKELSAASFKYTIELEREIIKHISENRLLKVIFSGLMSADGYIDFEQLQENLCDNFLYLNIINRSEAVPEDLAKLAIPETTILGQYIRQVTAETVNCQNPEEIELLRDSLKLGYALLSGKDAI